MWDAESTAAMNMTGYNSHISFYEYPQHKPFINSTYQPLRPSHTLSKTATLPESNRDQLLTALQSLSLKIKTLETERERAQTNLREIIDNTQRPRKSRQDSQSTFDKHLKEAEKNYYRLQDQHDAIFDMLNEKRQPRVTQSKRKTKQVSPDINHLESGANNADGRHYHLTMNTVPFILGRSTSPSHNIQSNVQNVIALLKKHNHQLCLSSKEYSELLQNHHKRDLSPHSLLYLDHYNKSQSARSSSASPVRPSQRSTAKSTRRSHSNVRQSHMATISDKQCYSRMKYLRQEFAKLAREHKRLNTSRARTRELEIIGKRMEIILDELECLQRQLKSSIRKSSKSDHDHEDKLGTPLETLRKIRLLQFVLKDQAGNQQYSRGHHHHRTRPHSND